MSDGGTERMMLERGVVRSTLTRWSDEPYRLFFPLGSLLAIVGVSYWLAFGAGWTEQYRSISHAMTQIQGFVVCIACGFLFTMLPRRTQSPTPSVLEVVLGALLPVLTSVFALFEVWILAQAAFIALCSLMLRFVAQRVGRQCQRRPPNSFVWLPLGFALAIVGALGGGGAAALDWWQLHDLGSRAVLQGLPLCLFVGVSSLVVPLMTRGVAPPDGFGSPRDRRVIAWQLAGFGVLMTSFAVELWSPAWGYLMRALPIWMQLLLGAQVWHPPSRPGLSRWLIWIAALCVPAGLTVAALFRPLGKGALHITFIGGFFLLLAAVSHRVVLGHGDEAVDTPRLSVLLIAVGAVSALAARIAMELDAIRIQLWMVVASVSLLVAIASWAISVMPTLLRRNRDL